MSNAYQSAHDTPEQRREKAVFMLEQMQRSVAQLASVMEVARRQNEECKAFSEWFRSLDDDGKLQNIDRLRQWADWSTARRVLIEKIKCDVSALSQKLAATFPKPSAPNARQPPWIGELVVCLIVPPDRQEDRLADFAEKLQTVWLTQFGPRLAGTVYVAHALWSAAAVVRIGTVAAVVDLISRWFGR
jgi:hypothetical protein